MQIKTSHAPAAIGPYSQAIKTGQLLFISGQIPIDPQTGQMVKTDIKAQTDRVLKNLQVIVEAAHMTLKDVVKCTCFLKNMSEFSDFNAVYTEYFGDILPARECVEVSKLPKEALIEISAICMISNEQ